MILNVGKPCRVFAEAVDSKAIDQFKDAMAQEFAVKGALMPDAHAGYSLPIGAVVATKDVIVPAWIGFDIGCGMCAVPTTFKPNDVVANATHIFDKIYERVPVGFKHNAAAVKWDESGIKRSDVVAKIYKDDGAYQLGTLGGGNHFIEIGVDATNVVWVIIHSGSRGIGHATATHYMKTASGDGKAREGHFGFHVDSEHGCNYIKDLDFCLRFALENRKVIMERVENCVKAYCEGELLWKSLINRNHNHAELKDGLWIHRKGATHAELGMMGVIPGNMRDGSFIVKGKGNPEALWSSSHGAGRVLGRKEAKRTLKLNDFQTAMTDIVARVDLETLDESPFAYKSIYDVMRLQEELVETVAHVKPILNIKG